MATELNSIAWQKSLSSNVQNEATIIHFIDLTKVENLQLKQNNNVLNSSKANQNEFSNMDGLEQNEEEKKTVPLSKKISFKIKKTNSLYSRNNGQQKVSELTMKFNNISTDKKSKVTKQSQRSNTSNDQIILKSNLKVIKVTRKPSLLKNKPILKSKPQISKKPSLKQQRPTSLPIDTLKPLEKLSPNGTVKATIEIFEKRNSICLESPVIKPKVPDKTHVLQTLTEKKLNNDNSKTDFDTVQIINIPAILPQRRCDSMYETTNLKRIPSLKVAKSEGTINNIKPNASFLWRTLKNESLTTLNATIDEEKIYEELNNYEYCESQKYEEVESKTDDDDGYEYCSSPIENLYEILPPLPLSLPSHSSSSNTNLLNCYELISVKKETDTESNYESIYGCQNESVISSDQQSNSLYGRTSISNYFLDGNTNNGENSDLSLTSDGSDWIDVTDNEDNNSSSGVVMVREKQKYREASGWSQQYRDHWSKSQKSVLTEAGNESDHHYETLNTATKAEQSTPEDDYDSFDTDTESENSCSQFQNDGITENQLPEPPNNQTYVLTRLAASAGKQMRKLRRNWSLTKNDISKSLSRMAKRKSRTDIDGTINEIIPCTQKLYQNDEYEEKTKSLSRKGFLHKFRRSMSMNSESASELTTNLNTKRKSTFYLTEDINIDDIDQENNQDSGISLSSISKSYQRPQSPPPPIPQQNMKKKSTSWYAEVGLFKNADKRPNTFWYSEIGLYQAKSTPSSSSAENSGNMTNEKFKNFKNDNYCNGLNDDKQLRLQDEPLYQFYDAAVLDSVCNDGITSDFDSDSYEEIVNNNNELSRPSAMELISPNKNSLSFTRTLWCEIPEVIQSSVLSTLSIQQKKLQEAKFEMMTSEASYLNSLNLLKSHFVNNFEKSDLLSIEEYNILFSTVDSVRQCSESLLLDMEKCWQDNILLHGICDVIQKHAENNFHVYITYCENQISLDDTLKQLKERQNFSDYLKQLESSIKCQSLTLYSFLMLPMQRITRWPLLVDAVLKRLLPQDIEYITCQHVLAIINKIVSQCNEGARRKEREKEMRKITNQLEFTKNIPQIEIFSENRWLIRSGNVVCMQPRTDETKLTFGKRFIKQPFTLFLFNDMLFITKVKNDNLYTILHYCPRNLVELTSTDMLVSLPLKDAQGRHLIFLTLLENQFEKTVEFLLSCNSESDKERWIEALTPPKSEDPDETLYECWDCPQVTAIHNYMADQPDELALARGDVINVLRKMADGWYHGERIRDGQTGWFPANYTIEIANPHVRSRNLKQRYRLLAFSESYLKIK